MPTSLAVMCGQVRVPARGLPPDSCRPKKIEVLFVYLLLGCLLRCLVV